MNALLPTESTSNALALSATAPATRAAYSRHWLRWASWCEGRGACALPATPGAVADYLVECNGAGFALATLKAYCAAISVAHQAAGLDSPTRSLLVRKTLQGAAKASRPSKQAAALTVDDLSSLLVGCVGPLATRDRAALCVAFWGALRGDDLGGLEVRSLEWTDYGVVLNVFGKTEKGNLARRVPLERRGDAICPVTALEAWLVESKPSGPLFPCFRGRDLLGATIARVARVAGVVCRWSSHSLRAGLVTSAHRAGVAESDIQATTGHRSADMLRGYIREADLQRRCLTTRIGGTQ